MSSWVASLGSEHTKRNFRMTAERFLEALSCTLREATVEDVRDALKVITAGAGRPSLRQYVFRVKSLLSYAHRLGYTRFNAGVVIKVAREVRELAKRIVGEVEISHLIRSTSTNRGYVVVAVRYAAGLRVSELVGLNCGDVIAGGDGRLQLHLIGKGCSEREVLLPADLGPWCSRCAPDALRMRRCSPHARSGARVSG